MNKEFDLKIRTKAYALSIIRFYTTFPSSYEYRVIGNQLLRSGTSVGAQYREGTRAKSNADMISKFESVLQEVEESMYWLELLNELSINHKQKINDLMQETTELIAIMTKSVTTIKQRI